MKLAFDHQIFCLQPYGGISRYIVCLAQELENTPETKAKIFAPIHINRHLKTAPFQQVIGIGMNHYPWHLRNKMPSWNRNISSLTMSAWRPDIIHETYYSNISVGPSNVPRVVTVHDMIHELFPERFSRNDQTSRFKRIAVDRADHVICVSHNTRKDLLQLFGLPVEKTSVIYLGCGVSARQTGVEREAGHRSTHPYLLFVGERRGYKNFTGILKSVANSKSLKKEFRIVCFGGGDLWPTEIQLINTLGFEAGQVTQVAGDDQKLSALYAQAAAFVYPSMYEGFGLPPLEAMAHGCPVVTSHASSIPEVVANAGEYFDPGNIESMTIAIEKVALDPVRRSSLIASGFERIKDFSWAKCAEETRNLYKKLIY